jgi:hypothetical protein
MKGMKADRKASKQGSDPSRRDFMTRVFRPRVRSVTETTDAETDAVPKLHCSPASPAEWDERTERMLADMNDLKGIMDP